MCNYCSMEYEKVERLGGISNLKARIGSDRMISHYWILFVSLCMILCHLIKSCRLI